MFDQYMGDDLRSSEQSRSSPLPLWSSYFDLNFYEPHLSMVLCSSRKQWVRDDRHFLSWMKTQGFDRTFNFRSTSISSLCIRLFRSNHEDGALGLAYRSFGHTTQVKVCQPCTTDSTHHYEVLTRRRLYDFLQKAFPPRS